MRAVKGSCKRSPCRRETERECVWGHLELFSSSSNPLMAWRGHTPISGFKTLQNENANWISCCNNLKIAAWTQPAPWSPGKHPASKIKNSGRLNTKGFYLDRWVSPGLWISSYILFTCKFKDSVNFYWIFQLSLCVKSEGSIYLSLDPRSLPGTRNWSTLENIWDFTTLGSHILHRGGILCPLNSAVEGIVSFLSFSFFYFLCISLSFLY